MTRGNHSPHKAVWQSPKLTPIHMLAIENQCPSNLKIVFSQKTAFNRKCTRKTSHTT